MLTEIVTQILGLRGNSGHRNGSFFQNIDVKKAFRQVSVAPDREGAFAYRLEDLVFVDLRLQFGWQGSPGRGGVSERNSGSSSDDHVIGGSHQSDQPCGRGGADEGGRGAIATWMPGSEGARRRQERPRG